MSKLISMNLALAFAALLMASQSAYAVNPNPFGSPTYSGDSTAKAASRVDCEILHGEQTRYDPGEAPIVRWHRNQNLTCGLH